jgi:hypothetical protein
LVNRGSDKAEEKLIALVLITPRIAVLRMGPCLHSPGFEKCPPRDAEVTGTAAGRFNHSVYNVERLCGLAERLKLFKSVRQIFVDIGIA